MAILPPWLPVPALLQPALHLPLWLLLLRLQLRSVTSITTKKVPNMWTASSPKQQPSRRGSQRGPHWPCCTSFCSQRSLAQQDLACYLSMYFLRSDQRTTRGKPTAGHN